MLFTCRPRNSTGPGLAGIPGRFPGPAHARGKWFAVDIHCHVRSDKATAMVAGNEAVGDEHLRRQTVVVVACAGPVDRAGRAVAGARE